MAQKFVSPGVFTSELDQSFLAQGVGAIGAVLIGQTQKGPAFKPTIVGSYQEFVDKFGGLTLESQMPYAAKNYLKNAATLTVVRVLGDSNNTGLTNLAPDPLQAYKLYFSGTGTERVSAAVLIASSASLSQSGATIFVNISGATGLTASMTHGASDYWTKVFNLDSTKYSTKKHWIYQLDTWNISSVWNTASLKMELMNSASFRADYTTPKTAAIQSQFFGSTAHDLFEVYTLADGEAANTELKVSIQNVKPSVNTTVTNFGTFDVAVRLFGDTDQRQQAVETFTQCTMDPNSQNYVARLIGDQYEVWNSAKNKNEVTGTFANKSKYVRVKMSDPSGVPEEAVPFGHAGYTWFQDGTVLASGAMPFVLNQYNDQGNLDTSIYWGHDLSPDGIPDALKFVPTLLVFKTGTAIAFNLGKLISGTFQGKTTWSYNEAVTSSYHQPLAISASLYRFSLPFKGGFDGFDPTAVIPLNVTDSTTDQSVDGAPVVWLKKGIDVVSNPDQWDFNLMAIPGITNYAANDHGRQTCNDRADALFIMDIPGASTTDTISKIQNRTIDDNYAASYYPDVVYNDKENNRLVTVKPSVAVLGALAFNDRVGQPFFAPAGLNRGGLGQFDVVDIADRLTYSERSELYENRINPITSFPVEGIVVWGQKTLQVKPSALDRINVRRLLIYAKKLVASAAKFLVFEPNNPNTWQRFLNTVNPILDKIRQDQGIERFKVVMDSTVNTPDLVDRNIMTGKIFLQPTRSAEFIDLAFVITSSGVSFEE